MKFKLIVSILFCLLMSSLNSNAEINIENGLIIHYSFDDSNSQNQSANFYHAIESGGVKYENSMFGKAAAFDGIDDYLVLDSTFELRNDYTLAAWIRVPQLNSSTAQTLFSIRQQCSSTYRGWSQAWIYIFGNSLCYAVTRTEQCSGGSYSDIYIFPNVLTYTNMSIFLCLTVTANSSENRVLSLYSNDLECVYYQKQNYSTTDAFSSSRNYKTFIGSQSDVNGFMSPFYGLIDDFKLYNRVLTESEILYLYQKDIEFQNYDFDNDGIINFWDECPNTVQGKKVDSKGCIIIDGDFNKNGSLGLEDCIGILQELR